MDDLETALADPGSITIAGQLVLIKLLTIKQLPWARDYATQLFSDDAVNFESDDFILMLDDKHVALMVKLIALMTDLPVDALNNLSTDDFLALFNAVLKTNQDFFLRVMMRVMSTQATSIDPAGSTCFSGSCVTDTPIPSN